MADHPRRFSLEANPTGLTPGPTIEVAAPMPLSIGIPSPQFDPLEFLPPGGAANMRMLREHAADAHAIIPAGFDLQAASAERVAAASALKRLVSHPQHGGFGLASDDRQVVAAQKTLDRATENFERIRLRYETKTAAWHLASAALANVEAWLKHGRPPGVQLLDFNGPEPKLVKGENGLLDAVENRQRKAREIRALIHSIRSSCFPKSYGKQRAAEQVDVLVERGAVSVSRLVELDGPLDFPTMHLRSEVVGAEQRALAFAEVPDTIALIAWLHRDLLIKRVCDEIDAEGDDANALTHEQRQQREAEAQADLLSVERDIGALIWRAKADGLPVEFPGDLNPLAILQLRLVTAPRSDALPGTSPEHGFDIRGAGRR